MQSIFKRLTPTLARLVYEQIVASLEKGLRSQKISMDKVTLCNTLGTGDMARDVMIVNIDVLEREGIIKEKSEKSSGPRGLTNYFTSETVYTIDMKALADKAGIVWRVGERGPAP